MKLFVFFLIAFLNFSCNSQKDNFTGVQSNTSELCPESGTCSFEILKNKSFKLVKDDIGEYYPKITEATSNLLKFEFKSGQIEAVPDSGFTEVVYLEINKEKLMSFEDKMLKQVNASYGRLCFCRGQSGYFPIDKGQLNIKKITKTQYEIDFEFEINEVPQTLKQFKVIAEM
ncbi:hypothetical protein [Winogradskyella vidalii]|uniref:hypothetical protein n=1 Tax=Winogradskyella vidalii TaxID=2615024 RepID=UPI0015CD1952|nr:hypothetical protein [Winogradskyella vidalii]